MTDDKKYDYFIYKLYNPDCYYAYVGSTRNMTQRKKNHKSRCNNVNDEKYNLKVYKTIRDNDGFENWFMVILEVMPNVTKLQAEMQEDCYRVGLSATMNSKRATRGLMTIEEYHQNYRIDNKEHYQEYQNKYYENNREQLLEKANQKYDCNCGGKYTHQNKSIHMKTILHKNYISNNNL
tara:strand:- start:36 stop:572 length:537 start_codon:yes stop_codon:yes gene_type:complete